MYNVLYVTGSRAEYGIVKRLLLELNNDEQVNLKIAVTAMHLEETYGLTYKYIEEDGLPIDIKIPIYLDNSSNLKVLESMSTCQSEFGKYFETNKFDAVIILGDRYEIFSVATAAAMHNLPIIHLHGGELTLGNYDEFIRHCITKMSKLHLTSTEVYRKRVIQLGETPSSVVNIGALGAENSLQLELLSRDEIFEKFGYLDNYFVVVFHPETLLTKTTVEDQIQILISTLNSLADKYQFVFIGSNSDTGSNKIMQQIEAFCLKHNFSLLNSIKPEEYLALIKYSNGLIGNSSSGLIEVPTLKVPTINIGDRQKGRVRGSTVIDVPVCKKSIEHAIKYSQTIQFKKIIDDSENPYYKDRVLENCYSEIINFLKNAPTTYKLFYDINNILD